MSKNRKSYHLIQPFELINKSPTNRSTSKQTHSFSKEARFPPIRIQCPKLYYGGQHIKSNKNQASIGIGQKSDFTKDLTCSPSSAKYRLKDNFQINKQTGKGYPIGSSRETIKFASYISRQVLKNPPANKYNIKLQYNKRKNPIFTMGSRTKIIDKLRTIEPLNDNPGPGEYTNHQIDHKSVNLKSQKKASFSSSKSQRFPKRDNRIPGPGTYEEVSNLSNEGKYYLSKHKGGTITKFLTQRRVTQFDKAAQKSLQIPGAGAYKAPSQFGNFTDQTITQKLKNVNVSHSRY